MSSNKQFYTYLHCRPDGTPFYVGKGHGRRSHEFRRRNTHHQNIVLKHGRENITVYIFYCDTEMQALTDEVQQIKQLRDDGYELANQTNGGDGTSGHSPTADHIAKFIAARKGYRHSDATKNKMSVTAMGRKYSIETKLKMSDYAKNRTEDHKEKISKALKGRSGNSGIFKRGHIMSAETRAKMSASKMGNTTKMDYLIKNLLTPFDKSHCEE
jgi:hypothetical protein